MPRGQPLGPGVDVGGAAAAGEDPAGLFLREEDCAGVVAGVGHASN